MTDDDINETEFLGWQLRAARETWARLRERGVSEGSELELDFFYAAPTSARASELMRFLEQETDYEVQVATERDEWILRGHTQRAPMSLAVIEQWIGWMVGVGLRFECVFDGWGAETP